jgi:cation-transporting ATPase E
VIFVEPPSKWWEGGDAVSGDRRPAALAVGLMLVFVLISTTPLRTLAALSPLEPRYLPLIIAALVVWLVLLRALWRGQVIERLLGMDR